MYNDVLTTSFGRFLTDHFLRPKIFVHNHSSFLGYFVRLSSHRLIAMCDIESNFAFNDT